MALRDAGDRGSKFFIRHAIRVGRRGGQSGRSGNDQTVGESIVSGIDRLVTRGYGVGEIEQWSVDRFWATLGITIKNEAEERIDELSRLNIAAQGRAKDIYALRRHYQRLANRPVIDEPESPAKTLLEFFN